MLEIGLEIIRKLFNYLKAPEKRKAKIFGVVFVLLMICSNCSPNAASIPTSTNIALSAITLLPATIAPTVETSSEIIISYIYFNGVVRQVESDEYAVIKNNRSSPVNLSGWRLNAGSDGQDFYFPNYTLQPGNSCRVYTNQIHMESCGFSFGNAQAIWKNSGDCGHLYDASGKEVDDYCY